MISLFVGNVSDRCGVLMTVFITDNFLSRRQERKTRRSERVDLIAPTDKEEQNKKHIKWTGDCY